jgi:ABC-type transporter MlaC component
MQIFGVQSNSGHAASSSQQINNNNTSSFQSYFSAQNSNDDAVQEFLNYAKETPAQRMFDSWLGSQHITPEEFASMSPEQQQALMNKFKEQIKQKLENGLSVSSSSATVSS